MQEQEKVEAIPAPEKKIQNTTFGNRIID